MLVNTLLTLDQFVARRAKFASQMPNNSIAIIFAGHEVTRSNDTEYLFCQNKTFYYLTGFNEPDAVLVIEKLENDYKDTLFCLAKDPVKEVWHGRRIGAEKAQDQYGVACAYSLEQLEDKMIELIANKKELQYCRGNNREHDGLINSWLDQLSTKH